MSISKEGIFVEIDFVIHFNVNFDVLGIISSPSVTQ